MPTHQPIQGRYSIDEYLRFDAGAPERHEYRDGLIVPVQGGPYQHSLVTANLACAIRNRLRRTDDRLCDASLRVRVDGMPFFLYPDFKLIRGRPALDRTDPRQESVLDPHLIIEVLCSRSELFDRGEKFRICRMIDSLREYVLISTASPSIGRFHREPEGTWRSDTFSGREAVATLASIELLVPLAEVYEGVDLAVERGG